MHIFMKINKGVFPSLRRTYERATPEDKKALDRLMWRLPVELTKFLLKALLVLPCAAFISLIMWLELKAEALYDLLHPWLHKSAREYKNERRALVMKYKEDKL